MIRSSDFCRWVPKGSSSRLQKCRLKWVLLSINGDSSLLKYYHPIGIDLMNQIHLKIEPLIFSQVWAGCFQMMGIHDLMAMGITSSVFHHHGNFRRKQFTASNLRGKQWKTCISRMVLRENRQEAPFQSHNSPLRWCHCWTLGARGRCIDLETDKTTGFVGFFLSSLVFYMLCFFQAPVDFM